MPGNTPRTTLQRLPERSCADLGTAHAILDEGVLCHVGFERDGQPHVIPMAYARDGDDVVLHGSSASRLMQSLRSGAPVCFCVTLLDGLVLARPTRADATRDEHSRAAARDRPHGHAVAALHVVGVTPPVA